MGLSSAIDWWDEWKLRILVLCSVFVQFFLSFAVFVRTWYVLRRLRVLVWLAYIGGDALAVYALATLFNRQKQQTTADGGGGGGGSALEVIWAPVLLIHLGGQNISAYSLEDNELWKRHAITLVSQVTVALYVFCKWWSGDKTLLQAAVLLFVVGILRFSEKPWALQRASFRTVARTNLSLPPRDQGSGTSSGPWSVWCVLCTCADLLAVAQANDMKDGVKLSLEEFVQKARMSVMMKLAGLDAEEPEARFYAQQEELEKNMKLYRRPIYNMFLDLSAPYSFRLDLLKSFLKFSDEYQHIMLRQWILFQFSATYTKVRLTATCLGLCLLCLLPSLASASVILFAKSHKDGYNKSDITVTYILFSAAAVLEIIPLCMLFSFMCLPRIFRRCSDNNLLQGIAHYHWQDMVSQQNIMSFCARKKKPSTLMKLAAFSYLLKGYINKHWYIRYKPAAQQISVLVRKHVQDGWKEHIREPWPATYRMFSNCRGDLTLTKHHLLGQLGWSLDLPFDDCVILWHIATDLCIHSTTTTPSSSSSSHHQQMMMSEIISNYMIYLLFICPEMLMPGTRQDLFTLACDDIQLVIKKKPLDETSSIAQQILDMEQGDKNLMEAPRISDAHKLAKALIGLKDDKNQTKMWEVIQGVWVEMICYSASRCRGYLHARSLAHGGEYLTNVWLLWSCMGMETLPDMMHNPVQPTGAAAPV